MSISSGLAERCSTAVVTERKVRAGDIILLHADLYRGDRLQYSHPLGLDFTGTYVSGDL